VANHSVETKKATAMGGFLFTDVINRRAHYFFLKKQF
jgi:hypothetical protein